MYNYYRYILLKTIIFINCNFVFLSVTRYLIRKGKNLTLNQNLKPVDTLGLYHIARKTELFKNIYMVVLQ